MNNNNNSAKFVEFKCSQCGIRINIPEEAIGMFYLTDCIERAKAKGFNSYCASCGRAFCNAHSIWRPVVPGHAYSPFCPICSNPLGGYNKQSNH